MSETFDYRQLTRGATTIKTASETMRLFYCDADCERPRQYVIEHSYLCHEHAGDTLARNLKGLQP
jgi:hypothetical protein